MIKDYLELLALEMAGISSFLYWGVLMRSVKAVSVTHG